MVSCAQEEIEPTVQNCYSEAKSQGSWYLICGICTFRRQIICMIFYKKNYFPLIRKKNPNPDLFLSWGKEELKVINIHWSSFEEKAVLDIG